MSRQRSILNPGNSLANMRRRHTSQDAYDRLSVESDDEKDNLMTRRQTYAAPTGGWYHKLSAEQNKAKMPLPRRLHGLARQETLHAHCHSMRQGNYFYSVSKILPNSNSIRV